MPRTTCVTSCSRMLTSLSRANQSCMADHLKPVGDLCIAAEVGPYRPIRVYREGPSRKALLTRRPYRDIVSSTKRAGARSGNRRRSGVQVPLRRVVTVVSCAVFLILAAGQYAPVTVRAGLGFQPISPEELKMTSEPQVKEYIPAAGLTQTIHQQD